MSESHEDRVDRITSEDRAIRKAILREAIDEDRTAQKESMSLEGMGFKGSVSGDKLIYVALVIFVGLAIAYMVRDHDMRAQERASQLIAQDRHLLEGQKKLEETVGEVAYILTLDDSQRKALKMDMPESLRRKSDLGGRR